MNIDANMSGHAWRTEGRNSKLTSRFHFSTKEENAKGIMGGPMDKDVTENLWKMYNKAKELLPYKERMENLTWRMMYVKNHKDYKRAVECKAGNRSEPDSSFSSSEITSDSVTPSFDDFDYKFQVQKMAEANLKTHNSSTDVRKRPAEFSPVMNSIKPHSNLSASLAAIKGKPNNTQFESEGAFSFQLDQMVFDGPVPNFSESFHSDTRSQTPTLQMDSRNNTPQSLASQGSQLAHMENNSGSVHANSYVDNHYSSSPLTTIGPSAILNGFNHGHLGTLNSSLVSLADHFRSQSNTPFTNQLSSQNMARSETTNHPPYPLVHANSFSVHQSPDLNIPKSLSHSIDTQFETYDYSTSATSTSNYFDSFNKNYMQVDPNSFTQNKRANTFDNFSSSLPAFLNETFAGELKKPNKKIRSNSKKKLGKVVSPDFNLPMSKRDDQGAISCTNCNTKATPLWRRDPLGKPLCNACGLFLKLHGVVRPLSLKTDVIKKRQRGSSKKLISGSKGSDGDDLNPTPITKVLADSKQSPSKQTKTSFVTSPIKKSKPSNKKNANEESDKAIESEITSDNEPSDGQPNLGRINEMDHEHDYFNSSHFSHPKLQLPSQSEGNKNDWDWLGLS